MKPTTLLPLLPYLTTLTTAKTFTKNVPVKAILGDWTITKNTITWSEDGFKTSIDCDDVATGSVKPILSMSADKKYAGCCLEGQRLVGGPDTAFDCCAGGHDLAGDKEVGFRCCPTGQVFDGVFCKAVEPVCENGRVLVDGECVCGEGRREVGGVCVRVPGKDGEDGEEKEKEKKGCHSGLETGKCYTFTGPNGEKLGFGGSFFISAAESQVLKHGRFQLCKDQDCTPNQPINPSELVYIRDIHGNPPTGLLPNRWLNYAVNGAHVGKTDVFAQAGKFSMTKWPCGKYCLGGFEYGLGPACPAVTPALTFYQNDKQACVPFDFEEVPCDIRADVNNCIWKGSKDQCCGKVDCGRA